MEKGRLIARLIPLKTLSSIFVVDGQVTKGLPELIHIVIKFLLK